MSDIVDDLRRIASMSPGFQRITGNAAAAEVERLRARVAELESIRVHIDGFGNVSVTRITDDDLEAVVEAEAVER